MCSMGKWVLCPQCIFYNTIRRRRYKFSETPVGATTLEVRGLALADMQLGSSKTVQDKNGYARLDV